MKVRATVTYSAVFDVGEVPMYVVQKALADDNSEFSLFDLAGEVNLDEVVVEGNEK